MQFSGSGSSHWIWILTDPDAQPWLFMTYKWASTQRKEDQAFWLSLELGRREKVARHPPADFLPSPTWARICKRLWSPEIDSEESIQLAYAAWRAGTTRVVLPAGLAGNRFLSSLKGLQIRALFTLCSYLCRVGRRRQFPSRPSAAG